MARVRRTVYACFYAEDNPVLDVAALLSGQIPEPAEARLGALAVLNGQRHRLSRSELNLLLSVPSDRWTDVASPPSESIRALIEKGLLVCDSADPALRLLRDRDEALTGNQWNLYAALYHYMTQWGGVEMSEGDMEAAELSERSRSVAQAHVAEHGHPPPAFPDHGGTCEFQLPGTERQGPLFRALLARRTTRWFDPTTPMTLDELDGVLRYVFGCHGYTRNLADVVCIKRTSPSGGGLHPIEAYPIISNVTGLPPGLYHYNAQRHSLAMLEQLDSVDARRLATFFMCGQRYFGVAQAAFILTARFYRNHWKYRRHQKAYAGILMDAAHLSQTLYLVGAELGLGTFVTIAINSRDIEQRLRLDGVSEGVIAVIGCGRRAAGQSPLEPSFSSEPPED
jgi:putative peptide maturation dehydrogenase